MPLSESYLGVVGAVGYPYANVGWGLANGSMMPVSQSTALFSVLGTTFGGDGMNNFALPDLRGREPVGQGTQPGGRPWLAGLIDGSEFGFITSAQMPPHEHAVSLGGSGGSSGAVMANAGSGAVQPMPTSVVGEGRPFALGPPAVVHSFIVCLSGIFPVPQNW